MQLNFPASLPTKCLAILLTAIYYQEWPLLLVPVWKLVRNVRLRGGTELFFLPCPLYRAVKVLTERSEIEKLRSLQSLIISVVQN
jgi:hypothetical protein